MLIKHQALKAELNKKFRSLYVLFGQDYFLLNNAAESIKLAWKNAKNNDVEETILSINHASDWSMIETEANSYSLFASFVLLDLRYDKKTIEVPGKEFITRYLDNINSSCLLILRAPNLLQKQLTWLYNHEKILAVQTSPLNNIAMQKWIADQLQSKGLKFEQQIPALIQQFTQGNMLACAQSIEKLELIAEPTTILSQELVIEQLVDQCDYQLFELADACLLEHPDKVIQLLRHASNTKVEPTLILWLLAEEIRKLIQLIELTKYQSLSFDTACNQLKIWPQRAKLYSTALKKIKLDLLLQLIKFCKKIDEMIKSSQNNRIWQSLEQLALSLCFAKQVGYPD